MAAPLTPGDIRFGTSSWSEKTWEGVFYPKGTRPAEYLAYYATRFSVVEADTTYYRVPDRALTTGWAKRTPDGFRICCKMTRTVVHGGEGAVPDPSKVLRREAVGKDVDDFFDALGVLGPKAGPVVLQFPHFKSSLLGLKEFLARLDAFLPTLPASFRYAVEVRNKSWLGEELTEVLRRHRAALVLVDIAGMPHPAEVAAKLDVITTDFAYARLIGDRGLTESRSEGRWDRITVDREPQLRRWEELLRSLRLRVPQLVVFANNHYAGYAPTTVERLMELMGEGGQGLKGRPPEQLRLF